MKLLTLERERRGWSRAELARQASQVGQFEKGRVIPYESQLRKLAKALAFVGDPGLLLEEASREVTTS